MNKQASHVAKGIAIGVAAGTAAYVISNAMTTNSKMLKKNFGKAVRVVGDVVDSFSGMVR